MIYALVPQTDTGGPEENSKALERPLVTDTGGPEENSKALERPLVKELGKLAL